MAYSFICWMAFKMMPHSLTYLSGEGVAGVLDAHRAGSADDMTKVIRFELKLRSSRPLSEFCCKQPMDRVRKWCGLGEEKR